MSVIQSIMRGKHPMPPRLLIYGTEGIGKSTLASNAPKPVFIPVEDGLAEIDCDRFPMATSFNAVLADLAELRTQDHEWQTIVIDSLDWMELLIWDAVCEEHHVASIEKADGGFQRGYVHALGHWRRIIGALDVLRAEKGMAVILIAHSKIERFEDPETTAYDRYSPRLHKLASSLLVEWVDAVLFATRKFRTQMENTGFGRSRGIAVGIGAEAGGERILRTVGGPSCIAKNRYDLAPEIPLSWPALFAGLTRRTSN